MARKQYSRHQVNATFNVGSMFDKNWEYVARCNAWTGEIVGHVNLNAPSTDELYDQAEELINEVKNELQLQLF